MTWRRRQDPRVRDELRYHRDRLIEGYLARGLDRPEAERRAFIEFGNIDGLEEAVRDVRGRWVADLAADARYALRVLKRSPIFAAVAVMSLALGIGANAAIFSVINTVMLRPIAVSEADRLIIIGRVSDDGRPLLLPYRLFEIMRDHLAPVSGVFAVGTADQTAVIDDQDELVSLDLVSGSYFEVLRVRPAVGRVLSPVDEAPAPSMPASVISDGYWRRRFGRSAYAVGKTVIIRNRPFTIVGVTPAGFRGIRPDRDPDLMLPLQPMLTAEQRASMDLNNYMVMARLRPGATVTEANADVQALY